MEAATEETTVESQGTEAPPETALDQGDYINDAFSDYFHDPRETPSPEAKTPEIEATKKATPPKEEKTEGNEPQKKQEEDEGGEKKPELFDSMFLNESGEVDLDKVMGISFDGLELKTEGKESGGKSEKPANNIPKWKQEYEEEKSFRQNIEKTRYTPLESIYQQINASGLPTEQLEPILNIIRTEYAKVQQENEQFFREREQENTFRRREEEANRLRDEAKSSSIPENARVNATAIINKLQGSDFKAKAELYNQIMFGPKAGGELLQDMFEARYPDIGKKSAAEQEKIKIKFVNELQADGNRLQRHFNRAFRYLIADPENLKRITGKVASTTEAATRGNALAAQKTPDGSVTRTPQAGNSMWSGYFDNPKETITRI